MPHATVLAGGALLAVLVAVPAVQGQQNDDQWKNLVMQALGSASANDYPRAEQAFLGALREAERFGPHDTRVGTTFNSLGLVYRAEKKYSEAEGAYRRALVIMEAAYGDSIDVGNVNFNIASVMFDQGHQVDALPSIRRTLGIYEKAAWPDQFENGCRSLYGGRCISSDEELFRKPRGLCAGAPTFAKWMAASRTARSRMRCTAWRWSTRGREVLGCRAAAEAGGEDPREDRSGSPARCWRRRWKIMPPCSRSWGAIRKRRS